MFKGNLELQLQNKSIFKNLNINQKFYPASLKKCSDCQRYGIQIYYVKRPLIHVSKDFQIPLWSQHGTSVSRFCHFLLLTENHSNPNDELIQSEVDVEDFLVTEQQNTNQIINEMEHIEVDGIFLLGSHP